MHDVARDDGCAVRAGSVSDEILQRPFDGVWRIDAYGNVEERQIGCGSRIDLADASRSHMHAHLFGTADGDHADDAVGQIVTRIALFACQIVDHGRIVEHVQTWRA